jgi:hypothetical protein
MELDIRSNVTINTDPRAAVQTVTGDHFVTSFMYKTFDKKVKSMIKLN